MLSIRAATTVSTYGSVEITCLKKKKKEDDEQFGSFDKFQFGTSAMIASDFDGLGGYRKLEYERQVPTKPYNCCLSRVFQASVCIATYMYGMSVPSLHTEWPTPWYNNSVFLIQRSQVLDFKISGLWSVQLGKALSHGQE